MPKTEATVQMDYAENWTSKYQDEVASLYYDKNQLTIHPMVVHFKDEQEKLVTKSYVGISSITTHSVPTTFGYIKDLLEEVKESSPT